MSNQKIPEDYFEKLPDRILSKIRDGEDGESIVEATPLIDSVSRTNPYKVPENYFSSIADIDYSNPTSKILSLRKVISVAALILVMIGASWITYNNSQDQDAYTAEEAIAYYIDHVDMIDDDLYIDNNTDEDLVMEEGTEEDVLLTELLEELTYIELEELQSELY